MHGAAIKKINVYSMHLTDLLHFVRFPLLYALLNVHQVKLYKT